MTMVNLPGVTGSIDVCDIAFILERSSTTCTIYTARGVVAGGATAQVTRDAVNAAVPDLMTAQLASSLGNVFVAGANVLGVVANGSSGSAWTLEPGSLVFSAIDPAAAIVLINACTRCGGGGGGESGFTEHNETDNITVVGVGSFNADKSSSSWVRSGNNASASPGDAVGVDIVINMNSNFGDIPIRFTIGNLPGPYDLGYGVQISGVNISQIAGAARPEFTGVIIFSSTPTSITFEGNVTTGGNGAWSLGMRFAYRIESV